MKIFFEIVLIFLAIIVLLSAIYSQYRKWKTRRIFKSISSKRKLETLPIKLSFGISRTTKLGVGASGTVFFNAEMHFDDDLIIVTPKSSTLAGFRERLLPIIFTDNYNLVSNEIDCENIFKPNYLKLSSWDSLTIKNSQSHSFSKEYLSFQIKPKYKYDSSKFRKIEKLKMYINIENND